MFELEDDRIKKITLPLDSLFEMEKMIQIDRKSNYKGFESDSFLEKLVLNEKLQYVEYTCQ